MTGSRTFDATRYSAVFGVRGAIPANEVAREWLFRMSL